MCHIYSNINKWIIQNKILQQWLIILKRESYKQPIKQWTFQVIFCNLTYAKSFLYITGERKHYFHIFAKIYFNLNSCKF